FEPSIEQNKGLLRQLSKSAQLAGEKVFEERVGLKAGKPVTKSGKKKSAGYPDIQIEDKLGRTVYLDCKTYNTLTKDQTFRTFFFSPSEDPKFTKDAFHLLISFELNTIERNGRRAFVPISWRIYTLDKLLIQVKHEFNASNKDLYTKDALLAYGKVKG
ncbi:MAG: hypothetical protein QXQ02_09555, partial [Halobacteria archaeon]